MLRRPRLPDIIEVDDEDALSSASTASFWNHERELLEPCWWGSKPPSADQFRQNKGRQHGFFKGLIRTTSVKSVPPKKKGTRRSKNPCSKSTPSLYHHCCINGNPDDNFRTNNNHFVSYYGRRRRKPYYGMLPYSIEQDRFFLVYHSM